MRLAVLAAFAVSLAGAANAQPAKSLEACFVCHGPGGVSSRALTPSIAGQPQFYVVAQLFLFREGRRVSPDMNKVAKELKDQELVSLANAVSSLPPPPAGEAGEAERINRGKAIALKERCGTCHGADFAGEKNVPRTANQREDYLLKALKEYKAGTRVGYGNAVMPETVSGLSEADLADVAHFLSHLPAKK